MGIIKILIKLFLVIIIMLIGIIGFELMTGDVDREMFKLGTTIACFDGCYNMLKIVFDSNTLMNNETIQENYHTPCTSVCFDMYGEK